MVERVSYGLVLLRKRLSTAVGVAHAFVPTPVGEFLFNLLWPPVRLPKVGDRVCCPSECPVVWTVIDMRGDSTAFEVDLRASLSVGVLERRGLPSDRFLAEWEFVG